MYKIMYGESSLSRDMGWAMSKKFRCKEVFADKTDSSRLITYSNHHSRVDERTAETTLIVNDGNAK